MPSIKQKFAGFLRQISHPGSGENENANTPKSPSADSGTGCFIQRYLNGYGFRVLAYHEILYTVYR